MSERLLALLIEERMVSHAVVRAAAARQRVYGGGLDTALLELGVISEAAIWARLATVTGLPVPSPALADGTEIASTPALTPERTAVLRAVPVSEQDGILKVLCAEPVAADDIRRAARERGLEAKLYIVPELRLLALRQRVYGETLPQRFAPLLAQAMGTMKARTSFAPPRAPVPAPRAPAPVPPLHAFDVAPPHAAPPAGGRRPATLEILLDSALGPSAPGEPPSPTLPSVEPPRATLETLLDSAVGPSTPGEPPPPPALPSVEPPRATLETLLDSALTPLEQVLELSPPLGNDSSLEVEIEIGGAADRQAFDDSRGIPVGLEVLASYADDGSDPIPHAPEPNYAEMLAVSATEALCRRARDRTDKGRTLALRALRRRLTHPRAKELLADLRASARSADVDAAGAALDVLGELRDEGAIKIFIDRLAAGPDKLAEAARRALVAVTAQDFEGADEWTAWWRDNARQPRVAWLLAALAHPEAPRRERAFEELRQICGDTFGYAPHLPRRKREAARQRWAAWWQTQNDLPSVPG